MIREILRHGPSDPENHKLEFTGRSANEKKNDFEVTYNDRPSGAASEGANVI